jgi:hypothetical protein
MSVSPWALQLARQYWPSGSQRAGTPKTFVTARGLRAISPTSRSTRYPCKTGPLPGLAAGTAEGAGAVTCGRCFALDAKCVAPVRFAAGPPSLGAVAPCGLSDLPTKSPMSASATTAGSRIATAASRRMNPSGDWRSGAGSVSTGHRAAVDSTSTGPASFLCMKRSPVRGTNTGLDLGAAGAGWGVGRSDRARAASSGSTRTSSGLITPIGSVSDERSEFGPLVGRPGTRDLPF